MKQWHCFKCKEPMVKCNVTMEYLETSYTIEGITCPKCGEVYLLEETVVEQVSKAEWYVESK